MHATLIIKIFHYFKIIKKFVYTKILRKKYYRVGNCKCCGECCKHIYVKHGKNVIKDEKVFKKLHYLHSFYTYLEIIGKDETGLIFSCTMQDPVTKKMYHSQKQTRNLQKISAGRTFYDGWFFV